MPRHQSKKVGRGKDPNRGVIVGNCPCALQHVRDNTMCHVVNGKRLTMKPATGGPVGMSVMYRGAKAVSVRYYVAQHGSLCECGQCHAVDKAYRPRRRAGDSR
jgi:hypothetical protein